MLTQLERTTTTTVPTEIPGWETNVRNRSPRGTVFGGEAFAKWLLSTIDWQGESTLLDALRDEITTVFEVEAKAQPIETSGTWAPDDHSTKQSEEHLLDELRSELRGFCGDSGDGANAPSEVDVAVTAIDEFETTNITPAERASLQMYGAARLAGAPIVDPPRAENTRQLLREDTPFYIALAFLKIFQTGAGDYWAFAQQRSERSLPVNLWDWFQHVLRHRSGRALRHPRFFYFAVNTLLRNKAVRGKAYFVRKSYGSQAYEEYTPDMLLRMSKAQMTRVLCAYEGKLPGSAAEKLAQRGDLEAMLNQLEAESESRAAEKLPEARQHLETAVAVAKLTLESTHDKAEAPLLSVMQEALDLAEAELAQSSPNADSASVVRDAEADSIADRAEVFKRLQHCVTEHSCLRRCVQQRGEVPVHFITLTTAIYHWDDLARLLREYEACTKELRGGRQDLLEPGENKVPADKRRVLQYIGLVAWYCAMKLELAVHYVLQNKNLK